MSAVRFLVLVSLAVAALSSCSSYKQVDDTSDGSNGKYKNRPIPLAR